MVLSSIVGRDVEVPALYVRQNSQHLAVGTQALDALCHVREKDGVHTYKAISRSKAT
jgi:hypothetical protein